IISPYFILDIYIYDDLFRLNLGYFGWEGDGRISSDLFYKSLSIFSEKIPDIYPIPLLISGFIFCIIFINMLNNIGITDKLISLAILACFLLCPILISNFSFRFDGAFMVLSMALSIAPFSFKCHKNLLVRLMSIVLLAISLSLYQAGINIFISISLIFFMYNIINSNIIFAIKRIINDAIILILGYLIYKNIFLYFFPQHEYASQFNKLITLDSNGFNIFTSNLMNIINILTELLHSGFLFSFILLNLFLLVLLITNFVKKKKLNIPIFFIISFISILLCSAGVILLGAKAVFYPRVLMATSVIFIFFPIAIYFLTSNKSLVLISTTLILLPSLIVSQASINSIKNEIESADNISRYIFSDMSSLNIPFTSKYIIVGNQSLTKNTINNIVAFPIIKELVPIHFRDTYDGGRFFMMKNGFPFIEYENEKRDIILEKIKYADELINNSLYQIFFIDDTVVVKFKSYQ
ncbi:glucosyltransferase domain-containing protein, partial [Proteus mirabilis]